MSEVGLFAGSGRVITIFGDVADKVFIVEVTGRCAGNEGNVIAVECRLVLDAVVEAFRYHTGGFGVACSGSRALTVGALTDERSAPFTGDTGLASIGHEGVILVW